MSRKPYVFISLPFLCVGMALLANGGWRWYQAHASRNWLTAPGAIASATLNAMRASDGGTKYVPQIVFTYAIDGVVYESDAYTFGRRTLFHEALAESLVAGYAPGTSVTVHYNPQKPSQAVLRRGDTSGLNVIIGTGLFVLALGGAAIGYGYWRRAPYAMRRG